MAIVPISSGTSVPVRAPLLATDDADWLPRHSQRGKNRTTQPAAQYARYTPSSGQWVLSAALARRPLRLFHFFRPPRSGRAHPQAGLSRSPAPPPSFSAPSFPRCPQTSSLTSFPNLILSQSSSIDAIPQTTPPALSFFVRDGTLLARHEPQLHCRNAVAVEHLFSRIYSFLPIPNILSHPLHAQTCARASPRLPIYALHTPTSPPWTTLTPSVEYAYIHLRPDICLSSKRRPGLNNSSQPA